MLDAGGAGTQQPHHLRRERHDAVLGRGRRRRLQRPDRAGDGALHEPDVPRLALLVRLPAADGEHPVAGRPPAQRSALTSLRRITPAGLLKRQAPPKSMRLANRATL